VIRKEVRGTVGRGLSRSVLRGAHRFDHHIDSKAGQARVGSEVNQHIKKLASNRKRSVGARTLSRRAAGVDWLPVPG
jgi:hypothetical protein